MAVMSCGSIWGKSSSRDDNERLSLPRELDEGGKTGSARSLRVTTSQDKTLALLSTTENQQRRIASRRLNFNNRSSHRVALIAAQALSADGRDAVHRRPFSRLLLDFGTDGTTGSGSKTAEARLAGEAAAASKHGVVRGDRKVELILAAGRSGSRARLTTITAAFATCTHQVVNSSATLSSGKVLATFVFGSRLLLELLQMWRSFGLSDRMFSGSPLSWSESSGQGSLRNSCRPQP